MKIIKILLLLALLGITAGSPSAFADENLCQSFDPAPEHFIGLYERARELGTAICASFGDKIKTEELAQRYREFAEQARRAVAAEFSGKSFAGALDEQMQHFIDMAAKGVNKADLPSFDFGQDPASFDSNRVAFRFTSWDQLGRANLQEGECLDAGAQVCEPRLKSLETAIEQYKKPYQALTAGDFAAKSAIINSEWFHYLETARSQTLLDAVLTTAIEQDYLSQDRLVGPMQRQWFAIHPMLVVENVSAAVDGDETSEALAIEWFGVNWWNKKTSPIGYPFGISIASVYSDRASVDEEGHGIMFHFNNSLTVGWADHDGDDGYYVTVDVLSLMAEKKKRWQDKWDDVTREALERVENLRKTAGED